jgi:cobalt-zinc-cadmium resistance protein CzcA
MKRHNLLMIWFLSGLSLMVARAQPVDMTLDEVLQFTLEHSPRLQVLSNDLEIKRMEKAKSWNIQPTEASYSFGQLNSDTKKDWQLDITQSLGSILTPFYENSLVKYQLATGKTLQRIAEKEITAEVKQAWITLLYRKELLKMYLEQADLYKNYRQMSSLYYEQGEISLLEKTMMDARSAEIFNQSQVAQAEYDIARKRLQAVCFSENEIIPVDTVMQKLLPDGNNSSGQLYKDWYDQQIAESQALIKVERSRFFPEISVGYTRQKILPLEGLNAFTVGVSVPLWFRPQQAKVKQAKLNIRNAEAFASEQHILLQNKQQEIFAMMQQYEQTLNYYEEFGIKQADLLFRTAHLQFSKSAINMVELIQSLSTAISLKNNYLQALYQYNVTVIEYELYGNGK